MFYLSDKENLPPVTLAMALCKKNGEYTIDKVDVRREKDDLGDLDHFYLNYRGREKDLVDDGFVGWMFEKNHPVCEGEIVSQKREIDSYTFQPTITTTIRGTNGKGKEYVVKLTLETMQDIRAIYGIMDNDQIISEILYVISMAEQS